MTGFWTGLMVGVFVGANGYALLMMLLASRRGP